MANELQVKYSDMTDEVLRAQLVTVESGPVPIVNTKYEGNPASGAVKIPYRADMVAGAYDKATGKALTGSTTQYATLLVQNDVAVNELIDGYDAAAVPDDIIADRLVSAAYAGAYALDSDAIATMEAQGTTSSDTTASTSSTAYDKLVAARTALSKANVPTTGRYAIVSPDFLALILADTTHVILGSALSDEVLSMGFIAQCAGFYIKESSLLDPSTEFIAGHADWVARVRAWVVEPKVQSLDGSGTFIGASAVQGRWVFDHLVTKQSAVYVKKVVEVTGVTLTKATTSIVEGATETLAYTIAPADAGNKNVTWSSSDTDVATVSTGGTVTAVAAGTATITITTEDGGFTDTCAVTVTED